MKALVLALVLITGLTETARSEELRYRGDYTYGPEVDSFCPRINSQCYWLGPGTSGHVRHPLSRLVEVQTTRPYESICVVIAGAIDRDAPRDGFAADFDGLIAITQLHGLCEETAIVTHGDLQHHRWVLERVNGNPVRPTDLDYLVPELDFGERMHVAGNTGCNRFTGTGVLSEDMFSVAAIASTKRLCGPYQNELERQLIRVLSNGSAISLTDDKNLILESTDTVLHFATGDWVR